MSIKKLIKSIMRLKKLIIKVLREYFLLHYISEIKKRCSFEQRFTKFGFNF
jgi:hypothetical protein